VAIFKMNMGGPGAGLWSSGMKAESSLSLLLVHEAWLTAATSLWTGVKPYLSSGTYLNDVNTYQIDATTGHATGVLRDTGLGVPGTGGDLVADPRMCTVVGLRSVVPGPRGRGRMFLPGVELSFLGPDGLIEFTPREDISAAVASALTSLRTALVRPGIHHLGDSTVSQFTSATVGQVPGTQRRRSNGILNNYSSAPIT
jgi:hypothetical protein